MKTIGILTTRLVRQGPTRQLLYLTRFTDPKKIKLILLTLSKEREPSLMEEFKKENVEIIQLNLSFFNSLFRAKKRIKKIVNEKKIDILHSFTYAIRAELVVFLMNDIIKIATIRNSPLKSSTGYGGKLLGFIMYIIKKSIYKEYDKIIACSNSIFELPELKKYDRVTIQNGIDISLRDRHMFSSKTRLREMLKLPINISIYLTISNGTQIKNIEFLIKSFSNQRERILIIAGDIKDEYRGRLKTDNIVFIGHTDKIFKYYQAVDFFVSASYMEGLPNAVLESLLLGTPCVLSNIPEHREILENSDESIGVLFENDDSNDLLTKMELVESEFKEDTPKLCTKHIVDKFSAIRMAKQYESLYLSIT